MNEGRPDTWVTRPHAMAGDVSRARAKEVHAWPTRHRCGAGGCAMPTWPPSAESSGSAAKPCARSGRTGNQPRLRQREPGAAEPPAATTRLLVEAVERCGLALEAAVVREHVEVQRRPVGEHHVLTTLPRPGLQIAAAQKAVIDAQTALALDGEHL